MRKHSVIQAINGARYVEDVVEKLGVPQRTIVGCSEEYGAPISETQLSLFLSGKRGASADVQDMLIAVWRFARKEVRDSRVPIDFKNVPAIRRLFREFVEAEDENNVIRSAREAQLDAAPEPNGKASAGNPA
jgi:hypothetical protein